MAAFVGSRHHTKNKTTSLPNVESEVLYGIECKSWVNCAAFNAGGTWLAVGDAGGTLSVYNFVDEPGSPFEASAIKTFVMKDSILAIEWSPDAKWLYAGGLTPMCRR
jgi:hypothetical protein